MNEMKNYISKIVCNKWFYIPVLFICVLSYGFDIFNSTIGIDDLSRDYYLGNSKGLISGMRWGTYVYGKLLSTSAYSALIDKFLGVVFLVLSSVLIGYIIYRITAENFVGIYTCLSCVYLSNSLINEIWEYNLANMVIGLNMCLVVLIIILLYECKSFKTVLISGLIMTPVISSYETPVFAYITIVLFVLLIRNYLVETEAKSFWLVCLEGMWFAIPLFIGVIFKYIIGIALLCFTHTEYIPGAGGDTLILWHSGDFGSVLKNLLNGILQEYFAKGLVYLPISFFVISVIAFLLFLFSVRCNSRLAVLVWGMFIICSVFLLSFVQGKAMPYRTAATVWVFNALVDAVIIYCLYEYKRIRVLFILFCMIVSFKSALYMNNIFYLNHIRSENELALVRNIGHDLYMNYDMNKPVVFIGKYEMGSFIDSQITIKDNWFGYIYRSLYNDCEEKYIDTDVNSLLNWAEEAFGSQKEFEHIFSFCGYEIKTINEEDMGRIDEIKKQYEYSNQSYSIIDTEGYIIVKLRGNE